MIQQFLQRLNLLCLLLLFGTSVLPPAVVRAEIAAQSAPPPRTASVIEAIRQRGNTLLVGVQYDYEPFGFINAKGEVSGFDVDLVRALADQWGAQVEFLPVNASDGVQKLAAGAIDLLSASLGHRPETERMIDFSQSYFVDQIGLLVETDARIKTLADLNGKTIAAVRGSSAFEEISRYAQNNNTVTVLPFQEYLPALAALKAGQVQALAAGSAYLTLAAKNDSKLAVLEQTLAQETYALGIAQGDSLLRGLVDFTLQKVKRDGLYDLIYQKWFPNATPHNIELFPGLWPYKLADSPTALKPPSASRFAESQKRGKLIVGIKYDFPPFGFLDAQNKPNGFEVDLAREFARRWLGDSAAVELVPVTDATRMPLLIAGAIDLVIAALPHTHSSDETIDFSQTYFVDEQSVLVKADSKFQTLADLNGKSIAIINGSGANDVLNTWSQEQRLQLDLLPFQEYPSAFQALKAGQVDAFVASRIALEQFARENSDVRVLEERLAAERYAVGLPNFDGELRDQVNLTLQAMKLDGTYAQMYKQWFGDSIVDPIEVWINAAPEIATREAAPTAVAIALVPTPTPTSLPETPTRLAPTKTPPPTPRATATTASRATATATSTKTPVPVATSKATATKLPLPTATPTVAVTPLPVPSATRSVTYTIILEPTATPEPQLTLTPTATATVLLTEIIATYTVSGGDTLATIAQSYYDDQGLWPLIYEANKALIGANPNILVVGLELKIPAQPK